MLLPPPLKENHYSFVLKSNFLKFDHYGEESTFMTLNRHIYIFHAESNDTYLVQFIIVPLYIKLVKLDIFDFRQS